VPDNGPSKPIRATDPDRQAFFTMHILADTSEDINDIENKIAAMKRWVDGADQQALRYHMAGDSDEILLKVQPNGSTNATVHSVKWGFVDDGRSFYSGQQRGTAHARDVVVMLNLEPYGRAENDITLRNDLFNSPHFIEESVTGGLAAGWIAAGTPTLTLDTSTYLIGGQSQKVVFGSDASGHGIESDTVANASDTDVVGYVWVYVEAGSEPRMRIIDKDSADSPLVTVNCVAGDEDKSVIGPDGNTWRRFSVTYGSISSNHDVAMKVDSLDRSGGAPTFFVDGAYLELGTIVVPDAWASSSNIDNRNDYATTSQATENYLNYIDVWGVPGDAPALARWFFDCSLNSNAESMIASMRGQQFDYVAPAHWIEDEEFDLTLSDWTRPADGARTNGEYIQLTDWPAGALDRVIGGVPRAGTDTLRGGLRAIVLMYATSSTIGLKLRVSVDSVTFFSSDFLAPATLSQWSAVDFGLVNIAGQVPRADDNSSVTISIEPEGSAGTLRVDAVMLLPTEQYLLFPLSNEIYDRYIDGFYQQTSRVAASSGLYILNALGEFWTVRSGNNTSRGIFFFLGDATDDDFEQYDHTFEAAVTLTLRPQTRHLIGTL
jgi:hypothetical protein